MFLLYAVFALLLAGSVALSTWNLWGPVSMEGIAPDYEGEIREGEPSGRRISQEGVAMVRAWLERDARPTWDPFEILRHQIRYNALTSGYDLVVWMEPRSYDPDRRSYALYQLGQRLLLRVEPTGRNRVLETRFDAADLIRALTPFITPHAE